MTNRDEKILEGFYLSIEYFRKKSFTEPKTCYENQLKTAGIIHAMARADLIDPHEFTLMINLLWRDVKGLFNYAHEKVNY